MTDAVTLDAVRALSPRDCYNRLLLTIARGVMGGDTLDRGGTFGQQAERWLREDVNRLKVFANTTGRFPTADELNRHCTTAETLLANKAALHVVAPATPGER